MPNKATLPVFHNVLGALSGKTLNALAGYVHGSVTVWELGFTDGTVQFLKSKQSQIEIGGTNEWDTGTKK